MAKEWADTERAKNITFFRYWIEKHRQAQEQCVSLVGERVSAQKECVSAQKECVSAQKERVSAQKERDGTQKRHRSRKLNQFFLIYVKAMPNSDTFTPLIQSSSGDCLHKNFGQHYF